ncbi:MAG: signal peptidase II [Clostridiales bacterium]|nr:signal peptidase II [Clostridiales bacterium]
MQDNAFTNKVKQVWAFIKRMAVRVWEYLKVAKMEWIVMISLFAADLISKGIVEATVEYGATVAIIPKFLNVHRIHNYAAAFGASFLKDLLGDIGARIFFSVFAVAASVAFVLVLIKNKGKSKWFRVSIAMFVAGAMGNCIDRMFLGYVRDFVEFEYFGLTIWGRTTWYVFNIADAELVVGVIMIVIYFLFMYKDTGKKKDRAELLTDELGDVDPEALEAASAAKAVDDRGTSNSADGASIAADIETPPDDMQADVRADNSDNTPSAQVSDAVIVDEQAEDQTSSVDDVTEEVDSCVKTENTETSESANDGRPAVADKPVVKNLSTDKPAARRAATGGKSGGQTAKRKPSSAQKTSAGSATDKHASGKSIERTKDEVTPR